ncbi:ExeM/NucH family extracellular endonuclease [Gleimia coleocanis]|uniref:ExeM/NucH family extracellular endonuclease n=1 Tax=Gleimia coleocanis TaxID=103618 RepID=UPI0002F5F4EF|nr:ExeM/NucH family extracellular endonuclease [Gleimia coleocanis]
MNTLKTRLQALGAVTTLTLLLSPLGTAAHAAAATPTETTIEQVQGPGAESPLLGSAKKGPLVSVKGRVTYVNTTDGQRKGFFIQTPGTATVAPANGSNGLFIGLTQKTLKFAPTVDRCVTVVGYVNEMGAKNGNRLTRLQDLTEVTVDPAGCAPVTALPLTEVPNDDALEQLEGMLVRPQGDFKVISIADLASHGVLTIAPANNPSTTLLLDDNILNKLSGGPLPFAAEGVTIAEGDTLRFISDVIVDAHGKLRLQALNPVNGATNSPVEIIKDNAQQPPAGGEESPTPNPGGDQGQPGGGEGTGIEPVQPTPEAGITPISQIQGTGFKSTMEKQVVTVKGVVTARYDHGNIDGFYVQTPGTGSAAPTAGSEAIFVYVGKTGLNNLPTLNSCVTVKGTVKEYTGRKKPQPVDYTTQLSDPEVKAATDCAPVTPLALQALPKNDTEAEAIEGMLVKPLQNLVVTDNYNLNTFGNVGLSMTGAVLPQRTDVARPGQEADAVEANNATNFINLDDGASWNYTTKPKDGQVDPRDYQLPFVTKTDPVRLGAKVTFNSGVIYEYRFGWVLQATQPVHGLENSSVSFENNRPATAPAVNGDVKIATYNVLNYFVHLGKDRNCQFYTDRHGNPVSSKSCSVRGAYSQEAFDNQQAKIVTAINKLGADVVGLEEVENSTKFGKDRDFALAHLVTELNKANNGAIKWAYVQSPANVPNNGDFIRTAFIYNADKVKPVGDSQILGDASFNSIARSPLAQKFTPVVTADQTGTDFVVIVNHFKSKRPPEGDSNADQADKGDGQGGWSPKRVEQAAAVANWANTTFAGIPVFMVGDFNSYSKEDAIIKLAELGFNKIPTVGHSYLFQSRVGSLDHAITNAVGMAIVADQTAKVWEINAHEPVALEYSRKNYTASDLYTTDEFRSSDHNPEIFGIKVIKPKDKDETPQPPETTDPAQPNPGSSTDETPQQPPAVAIKPIAEIQGTGAKSPLVDQEVTTKGIVTAAYPTGNLNGFYIQTPGTGAEKNPAASHGIFVYTGHRKVADIPNIGTCVEVTGTVAEFGGKTATEDYEFSTQLTAPTVKTTTGCDQPVVAVVFDKLPASDEEREKYEGMLVAPRGSIVVTDNYNLGQYGSLTLAYSDEALVQPTDKFAPGSAEAIALDEANAAKEVTLDDGSSWNYFFKPKKGSTLDPRASELPYLSPDHPVRVGAKVTFNDNVIFGYAFSSWTFQPTSQVIGVKNAPATFANNRPAVPAVTGDVKVATFNVLNYFTDLGEDQVKCKSYKDRNDNPVGTDKCAVRGAYTKAAFADQKAKIVSAISLLDADIISLEEIENSQRFGHDRDATLEDLVAALNEKMGAGTWKAVASPANIPNNGDAIRTAFIYKPAKVKAEGESLILDHPDFTGVARSPLAQKFVPVVDERHNAKPFVLIVNHFKSKGSVAKGHGEQEGDFDGQGNNNPLRVKQAAALAEFAKANFAEVPTFLLGDFNAYSKEDPIVTLGNAGFEKLTGEGHSYVFKGRSGSLDHVLANEGAKALVSDTGVKVWEINAHEPVMLEYARRNYNVVDFFRADQWRSSDHNPEVFGINVITPKKAIDWTEIGPSEPVWTDAAVNVEKPVYETGQELQATFILSKANAETQVVFYLHSDPVKLGVKDLQVQPNGTVKANVTWKIPANFELGKHDVVVTDLKGKELARAGVTFVKPNTPSVVQPSKDQKSTVKPAVPAPAKKPALPVTGVSAQIMLVVALGALVGLAMVVLRRRY